MYVPVAVNCCVRPLAMDGAAGVTAIETSVALVTVSDAVPLMEPDVAVMVEVPAATAVARPPEAMVAAAVLDELHVTVLVMSCVRLLLYVPVAVNCCVRPTVSVGADGVTAIETNCGAVTVSNVLPEMAPEVAVMVEVPAATPVARPPLAIVAAAVFDEVQVTELVMFAVVELLYVPVAVNCWVKPATSDGAAGVTAIETRVGAVTVSAAVPETEPTVAVIVDGPAATPVARPPAAIVAFDVSEEVHAADAVRSCVVALS